MKKYIRSDVKRATKSKPTSYRKGGAFEPEYNNRDIPTNILEVDEDEFVPEAFDDAFVNTVVKQLKRLIYDRYKRRFKNISIDADDIAWRGTSMQVLITLWNGDKHIVDSYFKFHAHDDYWEESDFEEHLNRSMIDFVDTLV